MFTEQWIVALEFYPGFSLYRGLYEFSQYASRGNGIKWQDISDSGMGEVFCIMSIEWFLVLIVALYIDQVFTSGKHPLFFFKKSSSPSLPRRPSVQRQDSRKVSIDMEKVDVTHEVWKKSTCISLFFGCLNLHVSLIFEAVLVIK